MTLLRRWTNNPTAEWIAGQVSRLASLLHAFSGPHLTSDPSVLAEPTKSLWQAQHFDQGKRIERRNRDLTLFAEVEQAAFEPSNLVLQS